MSTVQRTSVLQKLRERGHWVVVIRPGTFEEHRIRFDDLFPIVERNRVRLRGWDYPYVGNPKSLQRGPDWIQQALDSDDVLELWRFHTNGLFVHNFAMRGEWRDQSHSWPADPEWRPGTDVYYLDSIYSFVEIFEFAARLAQSQAGDSVMRVEISLKNLEGRKLVSEGRHLRSSDNLRFHDDQWSNAWDIPQTELIANPRSLAAQAAKEFFAQCGLDTSLQTLGQLQETLGR
jgi:hypothetical protein